MKASRKEAFGLMGFLGLDDFPETRGAGFEWCYHAFLQVSISY